MTRFDPVTQTFTPAPSGIESFDATGFPVRIASEVKGFDAAKVERISRSIQDGTFKVNPDAIADKLIANAQELLARTYR